jgi:hypothetical protein
MTTQTAVDSVEIADTTSDEAKIDRAGEIISNSVKWAAAAGAVPVPFLDTVALAVVQAKMLMDLSEAYDQKLSKEAAEGLVSVLLGSNMRPFSERLQVWRPWLPWAPPRLMRLAKCSRAIL